MVPTLHRNDVWPACDYAGHFDSAFDGLRAGVPEEERVEGFVGHDGDELFDELEIGLVECDTALRGPWSTDKNIAFDEYDGIGVEGQDGLFTWPWTIFMH